MEIRIRNDLYDITSRIRSLNEHYEIYFDTERQKYILKAFGVLQAVIPYDELDKRTLDYAYYTRVENAENILRDVDRHNALLEKEGLKKVKDAIEDESSRRLRLSR